MRIAKQFAKLNIQKCFFVILEYNFILETLQQLNDSCSQNFRKKKTISTKFSCDDIFMPH